MPTFNLSEQEHAHILEALRYYANAVGADHVLGTLELLESPMVDIDVALQVTNVDDSVCAYRYDSDGLHRYMITDDMLVNAERTRV